MKTQEPASKPRTKDADAIAADRQKGVVLVSLLCLAIVVMALLPETGFNHLLLSVARFNG